MNRIRLLSKDEGGSVHLHSCAMWLYAMWMIKFDQETTYYVR